MALVEDMVISHGLIFSSLPEVDAGRKKLNLAGGEGKRNRLGPSLAGHARLQGRGRASAGSGIAGPRAPQFAQRWTLALMEL